MLKLVYEAPNNTIKFEQYLAPKYYSPKNTINIDWGPV